jgi:uncharacterized membrane protein YgcG
MPTDYAKLNEFNLARYGWDLDRVGKELLAQRYDNRVHFIFELLQNAEDALSRSPAPGKVREVTFSLTPTALSLSHYGEPFTPQDVQFICGIGESTATHGLTDIGRFGIGFKSVYSFTDRPEIHSVEEHFAIESYVRPCGITPIDTAPGQTVFRFPLRPDDTTAYSQIYEGLARLDLTTLLFLREIEQIRWETMDGSGGTYLRETKRLDATTRNVTIIGEPKGQSLKSADFLVVERAVSNQGNPAGRVEIAYQLHSGQVLPVENATLSVFFPTIVPTRFGAILQGPFRTTPSRDNIPRDDAWNKHLVTELSILLHDSLNTLRLRGLLDAQGLHSLPIHRTRFVNDPLFAPLFGATLHALKTEPLLPCLDGQYRPASEVRLGRTKEIRDLFSAEQLGRLLGSSSPVAWISDTITRDKTPQLREYLNSELCIPEIEAEAIVSRIDAPFLSAQSLGWLTRFYEFLSKQESAWRGTGLLSKPIVRLSDGRHIAPFIGREPQAYLPSSSPTDFPTVHPELCHSSLARDFLKKIGLDEPEIVDDVIKNLLPRYHTEGYRPSDSVYVADLARIHAAFNTDSSDKKKRLTEQLRATPFVFATEAATGDTRYARPVETYLPTDRLKSLFEGITGVWLTDMAKGGQRYEDQRDLLRACGANEYLLPVAVSSRFNYEELRELRVKAGCEDITREVGLADYALRDLEPLLTAIRQLSMPEAVCRAALLWEALGDVETQRAKGYFSGTYTWFYSKTRNAPFDAAFVLRLRESTWVPKPDGTCGRPSEIIFETLTPPWVANPFLLSLIPFKPRAVVELAQLAGFEPGLLDLLKRQGITSEKEFMARFDLKPEDMPATPADAVKALLGADAAPPTAPVGGSTGEYAPDAGTHGGTSSGGAAKSSTPAASQPGSFSGGGGHSGGAHSANSGSYRPAFHTYVAVSADDEPADPEGLDHAARMQVEQVAIAYILKRDLALKPTPTNNPGFDLFEGLEIQTATRFVEVKSRKGPWAGPVALSGTQFRKAQEEGERFWLYVVENTANPASIRLHAIQDPAGKAHHFCFDPGWAALATP